MVKYGYLTIDISSPFPTTQYGHLSQIEKLSTYHERLFARAFYLRNESCAVLHLSIDVLSVDNDLWQEIKTRAKEVLNEDDLEVITSSTHTHYANNINDPSYRRYFVQTIAEGLNALTFHEYDELEAGYQTVKFDKVGRSRISGYESGNEYLTLLRLYHKEETLLNIIIHNCHPTILNANVPYFSSEYPGYILKALKERFPHEDFTFMLGASGDISSRFTRKGQDYDSLTELGDHLIERIIALKEEKISRQALGLSYTSRVLPYEHTFAPIDLSHIRSDLTPREMETIEFGKIMRAELDKNHHSLDCRIIDEAHVGKLTLGKFNLIFYPNEIFSAYLDHINLDDSMIVSCSNGYGPYILPVSFPYITYEMFIDTLTDQTKASIINLLKTI